MNSEESEISSVEQKLDIILEAGGRLVEEVEPRLERMEGMLERVVLKEWPAFSMEIAELFLKYMPSLPGTEEMQGWKRRFLYDGLTLGEVRAEMVEMPGYHLPSPKPNLPDKTIDPILITEFLRKGGAWNTHQDLSLKVPASKRQARNKFLLSQGYNAKCLYILNHTNYSEMGNSLTWPGVEIKETFYTSELRESWLHWLNGENRESDLEPIIFMMSNHLFELFDRQSFQAVTDYWEKVISEVLEPLRLRNLVLGLELDEYWNDSQIDRFGNWLKERCPWARIGGHNEKPFPQFFYQSWCDVVYYQYTGSNGSGTIEEAAVQTTHCKDYYGKPVIAAEYAFSAETQWAKDRGDACLQAGAIGALTGCTTPNQ